MQEIGNGLRARVAGASYGNPVCIEPRDRRDASLGVTVYEHEGAIVGVVITEGLYLEAGRPVVEYGFVPGDNVKRDGQPFRLATEEGV